MINVPLNKIVDENGFMTPSFLTWVNLVTNLQIITGTGSPEGVVTAEVPALYMDDGGAAGSILFIKRDGDIAGDRSKGWILV